MTPNCNQRGWLHSFRLILLIGLVPCLAVADATSPYSCRTWQTEDGLPNNCIQAIAQSKSGYLWFVTPDSLTRFDGLKFTVMDTNWFGPSKRVFRSICTSGDGTFWVATDDTIFRCSETGLISQFRTTATNFSTIFESSDGTLWAGTEASGLFALKERRWRQWTVREGLARNSVNSISEDRDANIWAATGAGANRLRSNSVTTFTVENGLLHNFTRAIYADADGAVWIGSHLGLTRFDHGQTSHYTKKDGLTDNVVTAVFQDHRGVVWIGTFNGLHRITEGRVITETRNDGTPFDRVNCLFEDREHNVWVGTRDGLNRLKPRQLASYTQQQGLTHNNATSVMQDNAGNIWVGFWGGGANRLHDGKVASFTTRDGLSSDLVLTMHQSRRGNMWLGMDYDAGINLLGASGSILQYREGQGLGDQAVKALADDVRTNLWIGTRTALLAFHNGKFKRYTTRDGLPADTIEAIHVDSRGRVWIGTTGGLAMFDEDRFHSFTVTNGLSHPTVTAIYEDVSGALWLGTRGGGLNRFRDGTFTVFRAKDGLLADEINGVGEDDLGFLWLSTRKGICRVDKRQLEKFSTSQSKKLACVVFDKSDGMASAECKGSGATALCKSKDGRLWFPTSKGVVVVDPHEVAAQPQVQPTVLIEDMVLNGTSIDRSNPIRFAAGADELVFVFTALQLSSPEKVHCRYRLDGFDSDWIDSGTERTVRYSHLAAGDYHFRVAASANGETWDESSLGFSVEPPFWKSWWFLTVTTLIAVGATAGFARYVSLKKIRARLREVEQQHAIEKERSRIAQDMHDELGARFTEILLLTDFARNARSSDDLKTHVNKISTAAQDVVRNLDGIVWAVNPGNDSLENLVRYIHEFADTFLSTSGIRCRWDVPSKLPAVPLQSELRHSLFLVVKEALNNIVKHSSATEVCVRIQLTGRALAIGVDDNGKGFVPGDAGVFGVGLSSMRKRIEKLGGVFDLCSRHKQGTRVRIEIELNVDVSNAG